MFVVIIFHVSVGMHDVCLYEYIYIYIYMYVYALRFVSMNECAITKWGSDSIIIPVCIGLAKGLPAFLLLCVLLLPLLLLLPSRLLEKPNPLDIVQLSHYYTVGYLP